MTVYIDPSTQTFRFTLPYKPIGGGLSDSSGENGHAWRPQKANAPLQSNTADHQAMAN